MRLAIIALALLSASAMADEHVKGYVRSDGTYVQPHYRSSSNQSRYDNYNSQGNTNPYTGQKGYERNEYSDPPKYNQTQQQESRRSYNQYRR